MHPHQCKSFSCSWSFLCLFVIPVPMITSHGKDSPFISQSFWDPECWCSPGNSNPLPLQSSRCNNNCGYPHRWALIMWNLKKHVLLIMYHQTIFLSSGNKQTISWLLLLATFIHYLPPVESRWRHCFYPINPYVTG